jgi:predicted metalloprotease
MLTSLRSAVLTTLALWLIVAAVFGASPVIAAQSEDEEEEVVRTVIDLLRLEGEGDLDRLYDAMAPESRGIIPRQAFVNWYSDEDRMLPADEPEIESITFDDWESDATGDEYEDVAFVEYSVEVEADRDEDVRSSEMILWNDGQVWRWFFAGMEDDPEDVAEEDEWTVDYETPYQTEMYQNLDMFWAQIFDNAGLAYHPPVDMVGVLVEPTRTGCGVENDITQMAVYYCTLDETIYYDPAFRDAMVENIGDYAWEHVIAHEWGHHVQNLLGFTTSMDPELEGGQYTIEHELQADCLAGMFGQDARARGLIRSRDLNEAIDITGIAGDAAGTSWDDPSAHGSAEQREESFWIGYDDGFRGCHIRLDAESGDGNNE